MRLLKNQKGFSLIELMIVVAIIGILAAVAIPNYTRFQNKAKQTEGKNNLEAIFTSEKAFRAEYTEYTSRFDSIGFKPEGGLNYSVGFAGDVAPANPQAIQSVPGSANCFNTLAAAGCTYNNQWVNLPPATAGGAPTTTVVGGAAGTFTAQARAVIGTTGAVDVWTINDNKNLQNTVSALD